MKVVHVANVYLPVISGVASSVANVVRGQKRCGHDALVITTQVRWKGCREVDVFRVPAFPDFEGVGLPISRPFDHRVGAAIREFQPDIVHLHQPFALCRLALNAAHRMKIPTVFSYHTKYEYYRHNMPVPDSVGYDLCRRVTVDFANHVGQVISPSSDMKERLQRWGVKRKIDVIPTGLGKEFFQPVPSNSFRIRYHLGPDTKVMLYVGRLAREKNLSFLLNVFERLAGQNHDLALVMVGSGPFRPVLEKRIQDLALQERAVFTGPLQGEDLREAYQSSDIFVFSSLSETQGLSLLEAMASGLPAVVLDADGMRDFVIENRTGFLVTGGVSPFAQECQKLLRDGHLAKRMGKKGHEVARLYSVEQQAARTVEVYEKLLSPGKQGIARPRYRFFQSCGEIRILFGLLSLRTFLRLLGVLGHQALAQLETVREELVLLASLEKRKH
ncbi:MAG: glycosyltransferase [Fidelibacterota bacterium]